MSRMWSGVETPTKDTVNVQLNLNLKLLHSDIGLLMPADEQADKGVATLAGVIDFILM